MRKKFLVCIALVLCLLLLVTMFVACNKNEDLNEDKQKETENREAAILALSNTLLSADSDTWKANMSDDEIAALSDAGDYIISNSWIDFFCDVILDADIRTSKIEAINRVAAEAIKEEKERRQNASSQADTTNDISEDAKSIFEYIKLVVSKSDLLGKEMADLAYELLYKVIDEADLVYAEAYTICTIISERGDLSSVTRESINAAKKEIERATTYLNTQLPETKQQEIIGQMAKAKADFQSIFTTMYNTLAILSVDISSLTGGEEGGSSMSSLSTQDILNVLSSLKKTIAESNNYFKNNQESVLSVSEILKNISKVIDTMVATNDIIGTVVSVVRYSGTVLSVLPFAVSFLYYSWDAMDAQFIDDFKTYVLTVEQPLFENYMFFFARLIMEYRKETGTDLTASKEYTYDRLDELDSYVDNDQYAALVYLAADAILNFASQLRYVPGDEDAKQAYYQSIITPVTLFMGVSSLKDKYADYLSDESEKDKLIEVAVAVYNAIESINTEIIAQYELVKPTTTSVLNDDWFINYYNAAMAAFFYSRDNTKASINPDLKHYIDETYPYPTESPVDYVNKIATNDFALAEDDQASKDLKMYAEQVTIVKLLTIIPTIIKLFKA